MFERRTVADQYPVQEHCEGCFLLVLSAEKEAPWVKALAEAAVPALDRDVHYLKIAIGLKDSRRPYGVASWQKLGRHNLERRWVLSQFLRSIKQQFKVEHMCVVVRASDGTDVALAEDAYLAGMECNDETNSWKSFTLLQTQEELERTADPYAQYRWQGVLGYRRWINENPDDLTSLEIGRRLKAFAQQKGCSFEELGLEELKAEGMNLLLAVGQGSERSPSRCYLVGSKLEKGGRPLMLLGKGITFDTGGINLKAHENFVNAMKNDMGGAALMCNLFMALVQSGYDQPLLLVIPTCENAIGSRAMKPGVVIQSHKGPKVIIEHTDAEGRLILADALSYAQTRYRPQLTLCAATLTTACLRQFSNYVTAVHFAPKALEKGLDQAGQKWGERFSCWDDFLPYTLANTTKAADLTNLGRLPSHANIGGGSNVAAHFLREFASEPFVHFDIFATCWNWSGDYPGSAFGATGAPFNSLFELIRTQSKSILT